MTENKGAKPSNIFNILSVSNKELAHSSMIKFLLDKDPEFGNRFFGLKKNSYDSYLELSDSLQAGKKKPKKRLRFDIVIGKKGSTSQDVLKEPIAIIENKYKSTPTANQLKLYDEYLGVKDLTSVKKYLMVYSLEQVPSDVREYAQNNVWKITSYFAFDKAPENSLLSELSTWNLNTTRPNEFHLLEDYKAYLQSSFDRSLAIINSPKIEAYYDLKANREAWRFFLYYMLGKITNELDTPDIRTNNDGGKNPIPSVAIWFDSNEGYEHYFGIDGKSLKLGFVYHQSESEKNLNYKKNALEKLSDLESLERLKGKIKNPTLKSGGKRTSVCSLVSFDITGRSWLHEQESQEPASESIARNAALVFDNYHRLLT